MKPIIIVWYHSFRTMTFRERNTFVLYPVHITHTLSRTAMDSLADRYRSELIRDMEERSESPAHRPRLSTTTTYKPVGVNLNSYMTSRASPSSFKSMMNLGGPDDDQRTALKRDIVIVEPTLPFEIEKLFQDQEKVYCGMKEKLDSLCDINDNLDRILSVAERALREDRELRGRYTEDEIDVRSRRRRTQYNSNYNYNPLPTPEDNDGSPFAKRRDVEDDDPYENLPSSPESFGSSTSQLEIELNGKISRLGQLENHNSKNVIKLRNVVNSSIELLNFDKIAVDSNSDNENDNDNDKLASLNADLHKRSQVLKDRLTALVDSFT